MEVENEDLSGLYAMFLKASVRSSSDIDER